MNQQRPHCYNPTLGDEAIDWRSLGCKLTNAVIAENAYGVSLRQHP
jgi:hypothetical protein